MWESEDQTTHTCVTVDSTVYRRKTAAVLIDSPDVDGVFKVRQPTLSVHVLLLAVVRVSTFKIPE